MILLGRIGKATRDGDERSHKSVPLYVALLMKMTSKADRNGMIKGGITCLVFHRTNYSGSV